MEWSTELMLLAVCAIACCAWIVGPHIARVYGFAAQHDPRDAGAPEYSVPAASTQTVRPYPKRLMSTRRKLPVKKRMAAPDGEAASSQGTHGTERDSQIIHEGSGRNRINGNVYSIFASAGNRRTRQAARRSV